MKIHPNYKVERERETETETETERFFDLINIRNKSICH